MVFKLKNNIHDTLPLTISQITVFKMKIERHSKSVCERERETDWYDQMCTAEGFFYTMTDTQS